jgi:hypothetical protein
MSDGIRDNQIKSINNIHQDEHQDSADAKRVTLVNLDGTQNSPDNPIYVQLSNGSINIGNVNAELEVQLSHKNNFPDVGDVADSVRVGDGVDELAINPDGSINVNLTPSNTSSSIETTYNEITAVPNGSPTLIHSFTAPIGVLTFLQKVFVSGDNIAKYQVKINGIVVDTIRTYFSGNLHANFDFSDASRGVLLAVGDLVEVFVEHNRPNVGSFTARIQTVQV